MVGKIAADLVLLNGKVVTMDLEGNVVEAVASKFGRVLAVGSNEEIEAFVGGKTKVVDVEKRLVLPGFIDSHVHPSFGGQALSQVNFRTPPNKSIADCLERLQQRVEETTKGEWIICSGYNMAVIWPEEGRHINRWDLDSVAPDNPVQVTSVGGHTGSVYNSYALKLAGITSSTPDPEPPAVIARDPETREPTGLVSESAEIVLQKLIPEHTLEDIKWFLELACRQFLEWGVTTAHDAYVFSNAFRAYQELYQEGRLPVRFGLMLGLIHFATGEDFSDELVKVGLKTGFGDDWLRIIGVKFLCDGAFTGRTAAMYEPYVGEPVPKNSPMYKGLLHIPPNRVRELVRKAHLAGLRPCVHAQGDYGIDVVLDAFEMALNEKPVEDHRMRIEHSGLTTPKQLERMMRLGVHVSSSIGFLGGDVSTNWVYWGMDRMKWTYAMKSLKEYGIVAGGNGDWPVTTGDPILGIATAVTRRAVTGDVLDESQSISVMDAVRMYTVNGGLLGLRGRHQRDTRARETCRHGGAE